MTRPAFNAPHNDPHREQPIDQFYRDQERRWERERVAPVGEPPTEEDLRRSLAKTLPKRIIEARVTLQLAKQAIDDGDIKRINALVEGALHDIRNIENGVLALCECVNGKGSSDAQA